MQTSSQRIRKRRPSVKKWPTRWSTRVQQKKAAGDLAAFSSCDGASSSPLQVSRFERSIANEYKVTGMVWPDTEIPHPSSIVRYYGPKGRPFDQIYYEMDENLADHRAGMLRIIHAICSIPRRVAAFDESPGAKEAQSMVIETLAGIPGWTTVQQDILEAIGNGCSFNEINWTTVGGDPCPYEINYQPMRHFGFRVNSYGEPVLHYRRPGGLVKAPAGKFLHARFGTRGGPWGRGLKEETFRTYLAALNTLNDWLLANERAARPNPGVEYEEGEDKERSKKRALDLAESMSRGDAIAYTRGTLKPSFLYQTYQNQGFIQLYHTLISAIIRLILAEVNTMDLSNATGAMASYKVSSMYSHQKILLWGADLGSFISDTLFRWLTELRVPGAPPPRLVLDTTSTEAAKILLEAVRDALTFGFGVPISHLRSAWKIPEAEPGEELFYWDQVLRAPTKSKISTDGDESDAE